MDSQTKKAKFWAQNEDIYSVYIFSIFWFNLLKIEIFYHIRVDKNE